MQYRIYCGHFVRLLRMFGSLQSSQVYLQVFTDKYILRVYYTDDEYVQFIVEEQQFSSGQVIQGFDNTNPVVLLDTTTVELLSKLPLKDTKADLMLDISSAYYAERVISYNGFLYKVSPSYLYSTFEYSDNSTTIITKLHTKILSDIVNINTKCALNQNHQLYLSIRQGLIVLNKDASIASYIDSQYILPDSSTEHIEDLELLIDKPKFISNFLTEVKVDSNTTIDVYSNIIRLNSYVSVGKKELFKYQLILKVSSVTNRLRWSSLLDLKNEIQRRGKALVLSSAKIEHLIFLSTEHDTGALLYIAKAKGIAVDIALRIFKPLIPKDKNDNFQGIEVILHKDKLLVSNEDVFTIVTLSIKLSDVEQL